MESKIQFKIHLFTNQVHFLDVTVSLKHGKLRTKLSTKPTDSHFYLHTSSCHPSIKCFKKDTQRTVYSILTYMLAKIGLPLEQRNPV